MGNDQHIKMHSLRVFVGLAAATAICMFSSGWLNRTSPAQMMAATPGEEHPSGASSPDVGRFIQIPGPNPILVTGEAGAWDGGVIEAGNVLKDQNTYYFYYHGRPKDKNKWPRTGYRIGVATAPHPLGPWRKYEGNPIIDLGPMGSWEDEGVACPAVLKEGENKWYMWYCGIGTNGNNHGLSIGLATASSPSGPWKKYEGNPVLRDFGYVGGVVKAAGQYRMYSVWPVGSTSPDQGAIYVATADMPEGPWRRYSDRPVIPAGDWGAWDDGGYSESGMLFHDGVFHTFYGGTKWKKLESIGYAFSFDGFNFIKYPGNPVAPRENNPDASAFAEVHAYWESPFYYLFHTLRYISKGPHVEDLGVQVLATQTPFSLRMPVLNLESLDAGKATALSASPSVSVGNVSRLSLTIECKYGQSAARPLKVHVRSSYDGLSYDTVDVLTIENPLMPGKTARRTVDLEPRGAFMKVLVENPDASQTISDLKINATLRN